MTTEQGQRPGTGHLSRPSHTLRRAIGLMTHGESMVAVAIIMLMIVTGLLESSIVALIVPLVYALVDAAAFDASRLGTISKSFLGYSVSEIFPHLVFMLMVLLTASAAMTGLALYISERHAAAVTARMSCALLRRVISASYLWFALKNPTVIANSIFDDVRIWRKTYLESILGAVQSGILILFPISVMVLMAPFGGMLALATVAVFAASVIALFRARLRVVSPKASYSLQKTLATLHSILHGSREVQVSGKMSKFLDSFASDIYRLTDILLRQRVYQSAPPLVMNFLGQFGLLVAGLTIWATGASSGDTIAQLALIIFVASRVVPAIGRLSSNLAGIMVGAPRVETLLDLMDEAKEYQRNVYSNLPPVSESWNSVVLHEVSFRFPGREEQALTQVNMRLQRGTRVGIVGRSGSGKSTVSNLILGILDPTEGSVDVGGTSLRSVDLASWHRKIGYVPQDPFIINATLKENIMFGEPPDMSRLEMVVQSAELAEIVTQLPNGLDTPLGERGRALSGGQAQRVAIARALYRKSELIVFDEATSALDVMTEQRIYRAILETMPAHLIVGITHRLASLEAFDAIYLMDRGRVVDYGAFPSLSKRSSIFRKLIAGQEKELD